MLFEICGIVIALCFILCLKQFVKGEQPWINNMPKFTFQPFFGYFRLHRNITLIKYGTYLSSLQNIFMGMAEVFRKEGFFVLETPLYNLIFLTTPDSVEALLSKKDELTKPVLFDTGKFIVGDGLFTTRKMNQWRQHRKSINLTFHREVLKRYTPVMLHHADHVVQKIVKNVELDQEVDILSVIYPDIFDLILETTMGSHGMDESTHLEIFRMIQRSITIVTERLANPILQHDTMFELSSSCAELLKLAKTLQCNFQKIIDGKRKDRLTGEVYDEDRRAFLDQLIEQQAKDPSSFSDVQLIEETLTMFMAAVETTISGICWALFLLGHHPVAQMKLQRELREVLGDDTSSAITEAHLKEMTYLDCVIKETQRLYSSGPVTGRELKNDLSIKGRRIPAGAIVLVLISAVHKDPETFPDPEIFQPERFLPENSASRHQYGFIPFGAGQRNCVGQMFAMKDMKLTVASVVRRFSIQSLEHRSDVLQEAGVVGKPHKPMRLKFINRDI